MPNSFPIEEDETEVSFVVSAQASLPMLTPEKSSGSPDASHIPLTRCQPVPEHP